MLRIQLFVLLFICSYGLHVKAQPAVNSIGIEMVPVPSGYFYMGSEGKGENHDEYPIHKVNISQPFKMSATEITNIQFEQFDPGHRTFRGKDGFSAEDDEAVVFVDYHQATAFCNWLSGKEGKTYRLATEAEWEYACRAGTMSYFFTGDDLPAVYQKNQKLSRLPEPVSLKVKQSPPNMWGLYDIHGNVEEWCYDWYGSYTGNEQYDPVGRLDGLYRVTRGGSHNTATSFLRSASRMAMIPGDKHWLTGFRIVEAPLPETTPFPVEKAQDCMLAKQVKPYKWKQVNGPVFEEPVVFVNPPGCHSHTPFYKHNHCPAVTWCDNGDLLAVWFSADAEHGREMVILGSRLRAGNRQWDDASLFFKVPDRNMTGSSLLNDQQGHIYYLNGVEASGDWQNLALVQRIADGNGTGWSKPAIVAPEHRKGHQVIAGSFITREGWIIQACDAGPGGQDGSIIFISKDKGKTWEKRGNNDSMPVFQEGGMGGMIAGIHAGVVQLNDGRLLALGRGNNIRDKNGVLCMPMSISSDLGKTWSYAASCFPPIDGGQRLVLVRLAEGPILMVSFTHHPYRLKDDQKGIKFTDHTGKEFTGTGMYAALSFDEGRTWPVRKLITDGKTRLMNGGAWTGFFEMTATQAEPRGYLAVTQTPDGMIHLLSSRNHYRFNLEWLRKNE